MASWHGLAIHATPRRARLRHRPGLFPLVEQLLRLNAGPGLRRRTSHRPLGRPRAFNAQRHRLRGAPVPRSRGRDGPSARREETVIPLLRVPHVLRRVKRHRVQLAAGARLLRTIQAHRRSGPQSERRHGGLDGRRRRRRRRRAARPRPLGRDAAALVERQRRRRASRRREQHVSAPRWLLQQLGRRHPRGGVPCGRLSPRGPARQSLGEPHPHL
mmetsp:Transcript_22487/g.70453  ORF Transcript_22487/g.70453 Transcript_22487/m.70453 type:complete len:215 (+) Transcript_22487:21-665(+)